MDELSVRRALYTDPQQLSAEASAVVDADPALQQLRADLQRLDIDFQQSMLINVPTDLQQKLLDIPKAQPLAVRQPRHSAWLVAASVSMLAFAFWFWQVPSASHVGEQALAHVYHEPAALSASTSVAQTELNVLLEDLHATWRNQQVHVTYARYCHFDGMTSLHLVVTVDGQPVTLFVLPAHHSLKASPRFADQRFVGESLQMAGRDIVLVAENAELLPKAQQMLMESIQFTS
jgi:hypothetical protein